MVGLAPVPQEKMATASPAAPGPQEEAMSRVNRGCAKTWGYPRGTCHGTGKLFAKNCPEHSGPSLADCTGVGLHSWEWQDVESSPSCAQRREYVCSHSCSIK